MPLFAITNYHYVICWLICFIPFVRLSFSYLVWQRVIPFTLFRLRAHGGCDRSAEEAYSSLHLILPSLSSEVRVALHSTVHMFWDYDYVSHIVYFANLYSIYIQLCNNRNFCIKILSMITFIRMSPYNLGTLLLNTFQEDGHLTTP